MQICEFVCQEERGLRFDVALLSHLPNLTRSQIQSLAHAMLVNGKPCKSGYKLKAGDLVRFEYENRCLPSARSENIEIDIVYEDEDVIVLNKSPGLVTHPSLSVPNGTLVNALNFYRCYVSKIRDEFANFVENDEADASLIFSKYIVEKNIPQSETDFLRLGIVHRLDKGTSGLMITARNFKSQIFLKNEFRKRSVKKYYIAILSKIPRKRVGLIKTSIFRSKKDGRKFATSSNLTKGKIAVSRYKVLKTFGDLSLVKFRIYTGRTHQIRLHAKHIGCPIFADEMYGKKVDDMSLFLHCYKLEIDISRGIHKVFKTKMPKRFKELIRKMDG